MEVIVRCPDLMILCIEYGFDFPSPFFSWSFLFPQNERAYSPLYLPLKWRENVVFPLSPILVGTQKKF